MTSQGTLRAMRRAVAATGISCHVLQHPHNSNSSNSDRSSNVNGFRLHSPSSVVHCEPVSFTSSSEPHSDSVRTAMYHPAASATPSASPSHSPPSPGASASPAGSGSAGQPQSPSLPPPPRGFSRFAHQLNAISLKFDSLRMRCGLLSVPPSAASDTGPGKLQGHSRTLRSSSDATGGIPAAGDDNALANTMAGERKRPRVVIVGSGWGAIAFLDTLDLRKYDVHVISSRNYFTFTPLLPAVAAGTLPASACVAGVRQLLLRGGVPLAAFTEAKVVDVNPHTKTIVCRSSLCPPSSSALLPPDQQRQQAGSRSSDSSSGGVGTSAGTTKEPSAATSILFASQEKGDTLTNISSGVPSVHRATPASSPPTPSPSSASVVTWEEPYDYLIVAAGAEVNTFNIKGVAEHAYFLKDYEDALAIRGRLLDLLETAALPHITEQQKRQLLHIVVVGGGPTGVEIAAEIGDFLAAEGKKYYPALAPYFKVSIIEMLPSLLPMYSLPVQQYALQHFKASMMINVELHTQVDAIEADSVHLIRRSGLKKRAEEKAPMSLSPPEGSTATRSGVDPSLPPRSSTGTSIVGVERTGADFSTKKIEFENERVPCGMVIWATGIRSPSVCLSLRDKAAAAAGGNANTKVTGPPVLQVDQQLRVRGAPDVFALGDCSRMSPPQLSSYAAALWDMALTDARRNGYRSPTIGWLEQHACRLSTYFPQLGPPLCGGFDFARHRIEAFDSDREVTQEEFSQLLRDIDAAYRPPAPTAQNAKQQGQYLGLVFNLYADREAKRACAPAFLPVNNGALAYLGDGAAVVDFPVAPGSVPKPWLGGLHSLLLWRCVYTFMQPTWTGVAACITGWLQAALECRPMSRERLESTVRNRKPVESHFATTSTRGSSAATSVQAGAPPASPPPNPPSSGASGDGSSSSNRA